MIFNYNQQKVFMSSLEVEDPGNTALRIENVEGFDYYIIIKTIMGKTSIFKFGPIMSDVDLFINGFSSSYVKMNYKEKTINKAISQFINDPYKGMISNIEVLTHDDVINTFPNIRECFKNIDGE